MHFFETVLCVIVCNMEKLCEGGSDLARRKVVAQVVDQKEVVQILSAIARGEVGGETVKVSERLKAVELLGKQYDMFGGVEASAGSDIRVVVDYIGKGDGEV